MDSLSIMSNSHRQRKRKAPASSPARSTIKNEHNDDDLSSIPNTATYKTGGDGKLKNIPPPRSRRGKFTPEQRKKTARTRELGACETCRARKVRVRCLIDTNRNPGFGSAR